MTSEPATRPSYLRAGKRGTVVIPAPLRAKLGIGEGTLLLAEESNGGVLIRVAELRDRISDERRNQFWTDVNEAFAKLKSDPDAWAAELEERKLWDTTLMDGLDPDEEWPEDAN